ncbi:Eukaryotic translation initiation factor 2D [Geranomyces variabilis]|uniref:Eukaryotic translation initiation factor 2D n=1 Tax=Geranomyces variabilis TaxID=109894 RepID=A0AAD5TTR6_9FUNG|nr:Eukaryotic translation initiation factor 2D [Geranomyces variabilis]
MFKKPFHAKPQSHVRSSDRRKLRAELLAAFPQTTEAAVANLLPVKDAKDGGGGNVTVSKLISHAGDQISLYSVEGQPIFWKDLDGRILPTVYTLWKIPSMLPLIETHGPVLLKLFDGADLMLPGVIVPEKGFATFCVGDPVAVTVRGSSVPMAVGRMAISSDEIKRTDYAMRGKGVHVLHTYGDQMWAYGNKSAPPDSVECQANTSGSWSKVSYDPSRPSSPESAAEPIAVASHGVASKAAPEEDSEPSAPQSSPAETDKILEQALLTALKSRLPADPKLLPMSSSVLYNTYILPSRPGGTSLDIKLSSYKKVGKFLKAMEKRGLLKLKERGGETLLISVNRSHQQIVDFHAPKKVAGDQKPQPAGLVGAESPAQPAQTALTIVKLYKATSKELPLFQAIGRSKDSYYTPGEVRDALDEYVRTKELAKPANPRLVKIDAVLCDAILKKDEYNTVDDLQRDAIVQRLLAKMDPFHELRAPNKQPMLKKGAPQPITIILEQRQGRKCVTRISGFEQYAVDAQDLAAHLKVRCASSTSVSPIPGKASAVAAYEVMVQGRKTKECCFVLEKEYGIQQELLTINAKA